MRFPSPGEEVWVVGEPALGPSQFSASLFTDPSSADVLYRIGRSDPAADWPQFHPGPLSGSTGFRPLSCEIEFDRPQPAPFGHLFALDVFASTGPCPQLLVDINGRRGLFFLEPVRETRADVTAPSPIAGWAKLEVAVPDAWLTPGANRIRLTTVELDSAADAPDRAPQPFFGNLFGSGFQYGRVGLYVAAVPPSTQSEVRLIPLPLFIEEDGELRELADVLVDAPVGFSSAQATVRLSDPAATELKVSFAGCDFGQTRLRIALPALTETCSASVDLDVDGALRTVHSRFEPARRWTVHVIPHVHLDVGYTDLQGKVIELHSRNVERAVDILKRNPDYAFSLDGSFILRRFFGSRSDASSLAARNALASGRVTTQAFHTLFLTGLATLEECYRSAYYTADLHDELGLASSYANLTDVPSYSWAIPSILGDLGVDAFMGIQNHTRAGNEDSDVQHLLSPVRWQGPDGQHVLAFFADCYAGLRRIFADPPTVTGGTDGLCRLLARYERIDYLPADLPIVGSHADNEDLAEGEADLVSRWNERYVYPRLRYSTIADYFEAVRPLQDRLPVYTGDGGSYWEDGVGSAAGAMVTYRAAQTALPAVEALAALVAELGSNLAPPRDELDQAWQALEFGCEHTWTAYHAVAHPGSEESGRQTAWKVHQVESAAHAARELGDRSMSQLAEELQLDGPAVIVFNPLSWPRTELVEVELPAASRLTDAHGQNVPEIVIGDNNGLQRRRFLAEDVPAFGYRVFATAGGTAPSLTLTDPAHEPATADEHADQARRRTLTTARYRVDIVDGRIIGLLHTASGVQLVDQAAPYALGELLYVRGGGTEAGRGVGSERTSLFDFDWSLAPPDLEVVAAQMQVHGARRTPWGLDIELRGSAPSLELVVVELHLRDDIDDVEVVVRVDKSPVLAKESVYVAFPFDISAPVMRYDRQQGWVDPAQDSQPGACVDWFATQYAVAVSGDRHTVAWSSVDAPLFTQGDVVRGRWSRSFTPGTGWLFSWLMNNYWWTNFPASQSGDLTFRYRFRPLPEWDPAAVGRFGREARTALLTSHARPLDKTNWSRGALTGSEGTLLQLDLPENLVVGVFGGQRGDLILRVQETAGSTTSARLTPAVLAGRVVHSCTASERRRDLLPVGHDGSVEFELAAHSVTTLSLSRPEEDPDE